MKMNLEKKVGIFFIVGLILLMMLIELSEEILVFKNYNTLRAYFSTANGLRVSDTVAVGGVEAGKVEKINVLDDKIEVLMRINRDAEIKADSVAVIKMTSLLGERYVDISLGTPSQVVLSNNSLVRSKESEDIDTLIKQINSAASEARDLFSSFNKNQKDISGRISKLLDESDENIQKALKSFAQAGPKLDQTLDSVKTVTDNLKEITAKVNTGEGTLAKLINDPALYNEATHTARELGQAAESIQEGAPIVTFSSVLLGLAQ